MVAMEKRTREKVALIVFALLVIFAGIVLISYFSTGRSWTIAATFVDDTVGGMQDYTAILYSGVIEDEEEAQGTDGAFPVPGGKSRSAISEGKDLEDTGEGIRIDPGDVIDEDTRLKDITQEEADAVFGDSASIETIMNPSNSIGLRILSIYPRTIHGEYDGVFVSDARDLYERKGAKAITLNLSDIERYLEPTVISSGDKSVGVFSLEAYANKRQLREDVSTLREEGVSSVICITPRLSLLSTLDGIDIVICTTPIEENALRVDDSNNTLIVESPPVGDVGVILLSANNIATYRTVDVL